MAISSTQIYLGLPVAATVELGQTGKSGMGAQVIPLPDKSMASTLAKRPEVSDPPATNMMESVGKNGISFNPPSSNFCHKQSTLWDFTATQ